MSMIQPQHIAKALIGLVEDDGVDPDEVAEKFLKFARRYNLENGMRSVVFHLEAEAAKQKEKRVATITLAEETSEEAVEKIKRYINLADDAEINISRDKELLAGFKAYYNDKLYEADLQTKLKKLKSSLERA